MTKSKSISSRWSREKSGGITWLVELCRHQRKFHDLKSVAMKLENCQTLFKSYQVINSKMIVLKSDLDM